ncbi:FAD-binding domain [Mycolicibacterium sphagni]|uniref:FAD-binding domain-containing protein n=1 Tax=Mycolicibacterium sphagni TaxID=1786 RepID=A0A255DDE4_9MYCO|nr:FAD-binding domain [Mycolicibacterium sphagni]OYN77479.1 hypothetical protein CG716_18260 [Mycolicibacterium sphagni]
MKIAISGAGVAGVALAHWLHRTGHTPTLIERAPQFRTGGYVIDFWGLGYRVAERMGIETAIRDAGYPMRELRLVDHEGRIGASVDVDAIRRATDGKYTSLTRGDLAAAIYGTIKDDVETIFGTSITAIEEHPHGVQVEFDTTPEREFDLVIGADGLHSAVRDLTFGPESRFEHYLGCVVAAFVVDGYAPRDELIYVTHNLPGRQVGRFSLRGNRTLFLFVFRSERISDVGDVTAAKARLRREFADAGWECPQILAALDDVDDLYFDVVSQIKMDRWSRGRILLTGDAAACVSLLAGEGTGLAITESYVLAGELARANNDYRGAFDAYEARIRDLIEDKQVGARKFISFFTPRTRLGIRTRNAAMRALKIRPVADLLLAHTLVDHFELPYYTI